MWKAGQWYRYIYSQQQTFYYCEYLTSNGYALLRVEKYGREDHRYCASMAVNDYTPCEPPEWAVMEYDPTQQEDLDSDI
jgi:hypothetical protein